MTNLSHDVPCQKALILAALPATYEELAAVTGLPRHTVKYRTKQMRKDGECHTGSWKRVIGKGGKFMPIVHAGPGDDVPCLLHRLTGKQYSKRYRKRIKNTPAGDRRLARGRIYHWMKKASENGDALINALFGRRKEHAK